MKTKDSKTKTLVTYALLTAVLLLMGFTPLGYLKVGVFEITFMTIPVIIGAIIVGPACGAFLGGVFGLTSFAQCFGMSAFGATILSINPFFAFITCFISRLLMGFLCGVIFKAIKSKASYLIASLSGAILNTVFFMTALISLYWNSSFIQDMLSKVSGNIFSFIIAFVGLNGLVEAVVCAICGTAISVALEKAIKKR